MKRFLSIKYSLLIAAIAMGGWAFKNSNTENKTSISINNITGLQTGDIVLRESRGMLSNFFRNMSLTDNKYSHAGFIRIIKGKRFVYHYIDQENGSGFKIEHLKDFIATEKCKAFAIYRYALEKEKDYKLDSVICAAAMKPLEFDNEFNLQTNDRYYCTEWIGKCLSVAGVNVPVTSVGGIDYIAPDNIYQNDDCALLYSFNYEK